MTRDPWTPRFPGSLEARGRQVGQMASKRRRSKRRQPFTKSNSRRNRTKTERSDKNPKRTSNACSVGLPLESGRIRKEKCRGGRRKSLIRPDSAKEMEGFNLDFLPIGLGFPSEEVWISFRGNLEILHRAGASASSSPRRRPLRDRQIAQRPRFRRGREWVPEHRHRVSLRSVAQKPATASSVARG
jgi:hypothetical protein